MPSNLKDVWAKMPWRKAAEPAAAPDHEAVLKAMGLHPVQKAQSSLGSSSAVELPAVNRTVTGSNPVSSATQESQTAVVPAAEPIPAPVAEPATQESHMSFLSKFKLEFEKLFHETPSWIHTGESVVAFAAPVVLAIIAQFDPAVALVAAPIVAEIKADLSTVAVLVGDGQATPSLTAALNSIKSNLGALLTAGHIKDAKIQADVTLVVSEIAALVGELPIASAPAAVPVASPAAK